MSAKVLSGCERGQGRGHALPPSVISYRTLGFTIWQPRPHGAHQSWAALMNLAVGKVTFKVSGGMVSTLWEYFN